MFNPDAISVLARAISFALMFQAGGAVLFLVAFRGRLDYSLRSIQQLGFTCAVLGLLFSSIHYGLESARMAGEWAALLDRELQLFVLQSPLAEAWLLRVLALLFVAVSLHTTGRVSWIVGVTGVALLVAAFARVGHVAEAPVAGLSWVLATHVTAVTFWFGSLLPLVAVVRLEPADHAAGVVETFSRCALWTVAALLLAGIVLAYVLLPNLLALFTPYGALLIAKIAGFAALMGLAALNKWRFGPQIARDGSARRLFRRTVVAEYAIIVLVLSGTAILTTFFSP